MAIKSKNAGKRAVGEAMKAEKKWMLGEVDKATAPQQTTDNGELVTEGKAAKVLPGASVRVTDPPISKDITASGTDPKLASSCCLLQ